MDTRQIEYMLKIADEKNITRAADKLFLTQSALSQQLLKLEKELDTKLFYRNKAEWTPTPEGQIYLENAEKMLQIKKRTYTIIGDMVHNKKGFLSVGLTPGRGPEMFTHVYPEFHREFPNITIEPLELSVHHQQARIRKNELDIGFMTLTENQKTGDEYRELFKEELLIAVPEGYPIPPEFFAAANHGGSDSIAESMSSASQDIPLHTLEEPPFPTLPLSILQYEPFVLMYRESTVRKTTDKIFKDAGFQPTILFETSSNNTVISMIQSRLCCGIIPYYYAQKKPAGVTFYRMPFRPKWSVCVSFPRDSYLSDAAKAFIALAKDYWTGDVFCS